MNIRNSETAFYARVSSDSQARDGTIASQLAELHARAAADAAAPSPERIFLDDGYGGASLVRPGLERLRDAAAAGDVDRLYVHSPDRLARSYAHQVLVLDELARAGVEVVFLNHAVDDTPEGRLLLQVQGVVAEYERAKILERGRRGRLHAARAGAVAALSGAPYGYVYITKSEGGGRAEYRVELDEARVVRMIFEWVGRERCGLREVVRRLGRENVPTRSGNPVWEAATIAGLLKNPAYKGTAALGKTRRIERRPRLRPLRGRSEFPRRNSCARKTSSDEQIFIPVPAIVDAGLFDAAQERLAENRARHGRPARPGRFLAQGLTVCARCGRACYGVGYTEKTGPGRGGGYGYYRCWGTQGRHFGGQAVCSCRSVRSDRLDAAVWDDARTLLLDPKRVEAEHRRRLDSPHEPSRRDGPTIDRQIQGVKRRLARLTEMYEEDFIDRDAFHDRAAAAQSRLKELEAEAEAADQAESQETELRLVIGRLETFASELQAGLADCDWETRQAIVRALVKRIEIGEDCVRVVYKVAPDPFDPVPREQGVLRNCVRLEAAALHDP